MMTKHRMLPDRLFRTVLLSGMVACSLASCTEFISQVDRQENWRVQKSGDIVLYHRPPGYGSSPSPDNQQVRIILNNQNTYCEAIQDSLGVDFNDRVLIYLYNEDEADGLIGTSTGGHSIPKYNTFYYTFMTPVKEMTDNFGIENPVIGAHELVHVITHRALGYPGTRMMSEGYAVWLDGTYGGYPVENIIVKYREEEPAKIMSPDQLLQETITRESVYYPNCGMLTRFMVNRYGVEKINHLFTTGRKNFKEQFKELTATSWSEMSRDYGSFIQQL